MNLNWNKLEICSDNLFWFSKQNDIIFWFSNWRQYTTERHNVVFHMNGFYFYSVFFLLAKTHALPFYFLSLQQNKTVFIVVCWHTVFICSSLILVSHHHFRDKYLRFKIKTIFLKHMCWCANPQIFFTWHKYDPNLMQ